MVRMGEDRVKMAGRMLTRIRGANRLNYLYYSYGGEDGEDKMAKLQRLMCWHSPAIAPRPAARNIESPRSSSPSPFFEKMQTSATCLWVKMISLDLHLEGKSSLRAAYAPVSTLANSAARGG